MRVQLFCFLLISLISIFHYFFMVKGLSFSRRHDGLVCCATYQEVRVQDLAVSMTVVFLGN